MPVDVTKLLTPADHRLVARAKKRGEKAAQKVMQAIARRAGRTAFECNEKIAAELADPIDRVWPPQFLARKTK